MAEAFIFDTLDLPSATTDAVREAVASGRGRVVVGEAGTGKTRAVSAAVNGALWSTACVGPLAVPRLVVDLAAQAGASSSVTRAYVDEGFGAAASALDIALGDRVVVVDAAERLGVFGGYDDEGFDEPSVAMLWSGEQRKAVEWLVARVGRTPQVVLSRVDLAGASAHDVTRHEGPTSWPVKLRHSAEGFRDWTRVAKRLSRRPAGLVLAAATLRLAGHRATLVALEHAEPAGALGRTLFEGAPAELRRYLTLLKVLDEVSDAAIGALGAVDEELGFADGLAHDLALTERRGGVVRLAPFIAESLPAARPDDTGARSLLAAACQWLLGGVNSRSSMAPADGLRVLDAHRLQLALGDIDGAFTTAHLHLSGLVDCARGLSMQHRFEEARRAYGATRQLIEEHPRLANPRVRSYVTHYHAYNGDRAGTMAADLVQERYAAAVEDWPSNALWHGRLIEATAAAGDLEAARAAVSTASRQVPDHAHRDGALRVRPAVNLLRRDAPLFALELVDPLVARLAELREGDPVAGSRLSQMVGQWADRGYDLVRLDVGDGRSVAFVGPVRLRVTEPEPGRWRAEVRYPPAHAERETPLEAVRALARSIADETERLVRTPTGRLDRHDVGRKGLYLGAVDLVASALAIPFVTTRWLLGRLVGAPSVFAPASPGDGHLPPVALGIEAPADPEGLYFARFPVDRTGAPAGPVDRLVPAGSGGDLAQLEAALRALRRGDEAA